MKQILVHYHNTYIHTYNYCPLVLDHIAGVCEKVGSKVHPRTGSHLFFKNYLNRSKLPYMIFKHEYNLRDKDINLLMVNLIKS